MRVLTAVLIVTLITFSCPSLFAKGTPTDDRIYDEVRRKLAGDSLVKGGGFEVEVKEGVVTIRGKVREEKQKKKATRLAHKVKGVKNVINELRVEPY
ncbi:MAG: BON domain-containing protein [Bryobacteraceae bacterium]